MENTRLRKGSIFTISDVCEDVELMEWYDDNDKRLLVADSVELDTNGVWVKDCPFRIDIDEIEIMDFAQALKNYIFKTVTSWEIEYEYNKGEHKAGNLILEFFDKTDNMDYTKIFLEQLLDLIKSDLFEFDFSNEEIDASSSILGFKYTLDRILVFINSMKEEDFFSKWEEEITNL